MRRTGSEEIGASKALGRRKDSWHTEAFAFSDFFGEAPERRPWILQTRGRRAFFARLHLRYWVLSQGICPQIVLYSQKCKP